MLRIAAILFLLSIGPIACAEGGGVVTDPQFPSPNAAVPSPNELRTCPQGIGCY